MTAKEYLEQARHIDQRINSKLAQIESLRDLAIRATAISQDIPYTPTSGNNHKLEHIIINIIALENEIDTDIDNLVDLKREIMAAINTVKNDRYRILLEMRYLSYQTWEQIAANLHLDLSWVYQLHNKALGEIQKNLKLTTKNH